MLAAIPREIEREVYMGRWPRWPGSQPTRSKSRSNAPSASATNERTAEHRAIRAAVQNAQPKDRALHYPDIRAGRAEEGILGLIFTDPSLLAPLGQRLRPEDFSAPVLAKIYARALELEQQGAPVSVSGYEGYLDDGELALLSEILSRPQGSSGGRRHSTIT
ncbi:MAG: DnaB-like helicase N-terminal domain-containing protein [Butyricicoccus pullicaecorum]